MKWKWNIFVLIKFTTLSDNTWKQNTMQLPNICDKKYRDHNSEELC